MKCLLLAVLVALSTSVTRAELYEFYSITSNDPSGYAQFVGESQLLMDVTLLGSDQYSLLLQNTGSAPSFLTEIHFSYASSLNLQMLSINNHSGVQFSESFAPPENLPHGASSSFVSDIAVLADDPQIHLGISPTEYLELIVGYQGPNDLVTSLQNGDLEVGLHVICIGDYSESFVNVVPEPATFSMALLGSLFMRMFRIRNTKKKIKQRDQFGLYDREEEADELAWVEISAGRDRRVMPLTRCEAAVWRAGS